MEVVSPGLGVELRKPLSVGLTDNECHIRTRLGFFFTFEAEFPYNVHVCPLSTAHGRNYIKRSILHEYAMFRENGRIKQNQKKSKISKTDCVMFYHTLFQSAIQKSQSTPFPSALWTW